MTTRGTYMKDGGMDREPHHREPMKMWKRGAAETIKRGGERTPAKSDGMHGRKLDEKAREQKAEVDSERGDGIKVVHVHTHVWHGKNTNGR